MRETRARTVASETPRRWAIEESDALPSLLQQFDDAAVQPPRCCRWGRGRRPRPVCPPAERCARPSTACRHRHPCRGGVWAVSARTSMAPAPCPCLVICRAWRPSLPHRALRAAASSLDRLVEDVTEIDEFRPLSLWIAAKSPGWLTNFVSDWEVKCVTCPYDRRTLHAQQAIATKYAEKRGMWKNIVDARLGTLVDFVFNAG